MYFTTKIHKIITVSINAVCGILGILLTWYGTWLYQSIANSQYDHGEELGGILVITMGIVVFISSIFGIASAVMEYKKLLICFAVLLIALIVLQFIMVSISHTTINNTVPKKLKEAFDEFFDTKYQRPNATLSFYEEWLKCCGKNGAEDYFLLDKAPPASCCLNHNCAVIHNLYTVGCEETYQNYRNAKTNYFTILSWWIIAVEFVDSIFACVLVDSIRNHRDRQRFYT